MKTLHLSIIAIVGIVVIVTTVIGVFIEKLGADQQPYATIEINGMKENYTSGEPVSFSVVIGGYGSGCGTTKAIIIKENDSQYKSPAWDITPQCAAGTMSHYFKFNSLSENTSINQPGNYILQVSFGDMMTLRSTMMERFSVMAYNITGMYATRVTPLSTVSLHNDAVISDNYFYYGPTHQSPKVELYDHPYEGIGKDNAIVSINSQVYYQTTLTRTIYNLTKGMSMKFQNVTFAFPEGVMNTPGGQMIMLDVKFPDGSEEVYGRNTIFSNGSGAISGISVPADLSAARNSTTVLGYHVLPQAGITIYHDKIKLLVSLDKASVK